MSVEPEGRRSSHRTVLLVVGIVGGVVLILLLACGVLGFVAFRAAKEGVFFVQQMVIDVQLSQSLAEDFLSDLAANQVDDAYELTSKGYRERISSKEFRVFIDKNSFLTKQSSRGMNIVNINPPRATFQFNLSGQGVGGSCTLHLIKEEEEWRIDQFTVP